jgi:hypothetical protein
MNFSNCQVTININEFGDPEPAFGLLAILVKACGRLDLGRVCVNLQPFLLIFDSGNL